MRENANFTLAILLLLAFTVSAQDYRPKPNEFPPLDRATYISGELVVVDTREARFVSRAKS